MAQLDDDSKPEFGEFENNYLYQLRILMKGMGIPVMAALTADMRTFYIE